MQWPCRYIAERDSLERTQDLRRDAFPPHPDTLPPNTQKQARQDRTLGLPIATGLYHSSARRRMHQSTDQSIDQSIDESIAIADLQKADKTSAIARSWCVYRIASPLYQSPMMGGRGEEALGMDKAGYLPERETRRINRLNGWTVQRFNRKTRKTCQKYDSSTIKKMERGNPGKDHPC